VLVHIDAHVERLRSPEQDQRSTRRGSGRELADADFDLQHLAIERRPDGAPINLCLPGPDLGLARRAFGLGCRELGRRRVHRRAPAPRLFRAHGPLVCELLDKLEVPSEIRETRGRHGHASLRDGDGALPDVEICLQLSRVDFEERLSFSHCLAGRDEDSRDHPRQRSSDRDVLRARFHEPHGRHSSGECRRGWRGRGIGALPMGRRPHNREGRPDGGQQADGRQDESLHAYISL
jgi:hypothetical protein